jgi:hypothetical protein
MRTLLTCHIHGIGNLRADWQYWPESQLVVYLTDNYVPLLNENPKKRIEAER